MRRSSAASHAAASAHQGHRALGQRGTFRAGKPPQPESPPRHRRVAAEGEHHRQPPAHPVQRRDADSSRWIHTAGPQATTSAATSGKRSGASIALVVGEGDETGHPKGGVPRRPSRVEVAATRSPRAVRSSRSSTRVPNSRHTPPTVSTWHCIHSGWRCTSPARRDERRRRAAQRCRRGGAGRTPPRPRGSGPARATVRGARSTAGAASASSCHPQVSPGGLQRSA